MPSDKINGNIKKVYYHKHPFHVQAID